MRENEASENNQYHRAIQGTQYYWTRVVVWFLVLPTSIVQTTKQTETKSKWNSSLVATKERNHLVFATRQKIISLWSLI